jgi:hypothetical protein
MPRFTLRFTGMALFIRHKNDKAVEVRFVTEHPHGEHPHGKSDERHVPVLLMSSDSWSHTSSDDVREGRAIGRPLYLAQFKTVDIFVNGDPLSGPVSVMKSGEWTNFNRLIPRLTSEIFASGKYSESNASRIAPHGVITLNGGTLSTEPPIHPEAESLWEVLDPDRSSRNETRNLTDVANFSFEFGFEDRVQLRLTPRLGDPLVIHFKPRFDITGWVLHQPFLASLASSQAGAIDSEIRHLSQAAGFLDPNNLQPRHFVLKPHGPTAAPGRLNPDDPLCPPLQIEVD